MNERLEKVEDYHWFADKEFLEVVHTLAVCGLEAVLIKTQGI